MRRVGGFESFACFVCGLLLACGRGQPASDEVPGAGELLATVNGTPLVRSDLELPEGGQQTSIRALLDRAVDNELLAQQANKRGVSSADLSRRTRQFAVQELLRIVVEEPNRPEDVPRALLEERYAQNRAEKFSRPERRASLHFLVRLPKNATAEQSEAAKRIAEEAWRSMRDEESARALLKRNKTKEDGFSLIAERVPAAGREAALDPAYRDALFEGEGVGRVGKVVRSTFGWHAIWVTAVEPAISVPFAEVEPDLRAELSVDLRREALDALLKKLRAKSNVAAAGVELRDVLGESFDLSKIEHGGS